MASAETISIVCDIIRQNAGRKYVVVSAPGKAHLNDVKVTDLLYKCFEEIKNFGDCPSFERVSEKFLSIVSGLKLNLDISSLLLQTKLTMIKEKSEQFTASRGEYLSALILAKCLNYDFVDASEIIKFDLHGRLDAERTFAATAAKLKTCKTAVVPGFYGADYEGNINTFSRGGSDVTGAIIARAVDAVLYENWTDVNGMMTCDPKIVDNPEQIFCLSYKELRELSYMGASVLHSESIFPVSAPQIPINIRNTFNSLNSGTMIVPDIYDVKNDKQVTGIVGKKNFSIVHIEKDLMNNEIGFIRKVLSVFEEHNIPIEHIPSGIDVLSVVIESKFIDSQISAGIKEKLMSVTKADIIEIRHGLSLIASVGRNMLANRNIVPGILTSLNHAGIVIKLIDFGSGGLNVIVGVDDIDFEKAIKALYDEFFTKAI